MDGFGLVFHHLGLAVKAPDAAFLYLQALGYRAGNEVHDPLQRVNLALRHHDVMPDVEVIWPGDGPSPIDGLLKRSGSLVYHLCYRSADPAASVAAMEAAGLRVMQVAPPTPAVLFGGREVSFYSIAGVGLIELIAWPD
jgi:Glyoxalase/Bleomycin resistance protein/Dioxygenase superfamily